MRALLRVALLATAIAGGLLLACGDGDAPGSPPDETLDAGESDVASSTDADADAPLPDARPPFDAAAPAIECAVTPCITRLVAGPKHYCAIDKDGAVRCWGDPNALGNFAPGSSPDRGATPILLEGIDDVVDIGTSDFDTCIAHSNGAIDCFGTSRTPTRVATVNGVKRLALGDSRSCAVDGSDDLWCWGDDPYLGMGEGALPLGGDKAVAAAMSSSTAFVLGASNTLYSWGLELLMLGRATSLDGDPTPDPVEVLPATLQVAASAQHVCAVTADGRLFCWGHGDKGTLGIGTFQDTPQPTEVPLPQPEWPSQVAVSTTHSCVRMTNGTLNCWSRANSSGELGYEDVAGVFVPKKVNLEKSVAAVATGTHSTCILATDGSVQCWGSNASGQLGLGQRDSKRHYTPTTVIFP